MKFMITIFVTLFTIVQAMNPFKTAITGFRSMLDKIKCQTSECCGSPYWVLNNVTKFEDSFDKHVFGQHIVKKMVSKQLKAHFRQDVPQKALVLSFHGWTGIGKNYVAKYIAESLFRKGTKSEFVNFYISTVDFPDENKVDIYKMDLQQKIIEVVKKCSQAMFIFDEVDKMPSTLVDAIKPFIDYHDSVKGVDFRRSIFIFLSNTGGSQINEIAFQAWTEGRLRESIEYKELEKLVKTGAFNEIGGLHHSAVIGNHLVDRFIPFLPLERDHVAKCVITEFARNSKMDIKKEDIDDILQELVFHPKDYSLYSATG